MRHFTSASRLLCFIRCTHYQVPNSDRTRCFFLVCKILYLQEELFQIGGIRLDDLDAEETLGAISSYSTKELISEFGYKRFGVMQRLGTTKKDYYSFCKAVENSPNINNLCEEVADWLPVIKATCRIQLSQRKNKSLSRDIESTEFGSGIF